MYFYMRILFMKFHARFESFLFMPELTATDSYSLLVTFLFAIMLKKPRKFPPKSAIGGRYRG